MELRERMRQAIVVGSKEWGKTRQHAVTDAVTEAASAAVAEVVDARDAQACEELAAALRRENPPMYERYVFDQLQLRVDLRHYCAEAVAEEREASCCDVCGWCRKARDDGDPFEMREIASGRWRHIFKDGDWVPCEARDIRARAAAGTGGGEAGDG